MVNSFAVLVDVVKDRRMNVPSSEIFEQDLFFTRILVNKVLSISRPVLISHFAVSIIARSRKLLRIVKSDGFCNHLDIGI